MLLDVEMNAPMIIYGAVLLFILGSVLGSFLNCVCVRIVNGENYVKGKSHCMTCGHELAAKDLIPVLSWLLLGGKCRYCKAKITPRYFLTEVFLGSAFVITWLRFGLSIEMLCCLIIECLVFCAALCDMDTKEIPDRFFLAVTILWVVRTLVESLFINKAWDGKAILFSLAGGIGVALVMFLISLLLGHILQKETLGFGDVKMLFALGLHLSLGRSILNVILTCIIGLILMLLTKNRKEAMPLMPSIAIATFLTLMVGSELVNLYLQILL